MSILVYAVLLVPASVGLDDSPGLTRLEAAKAELSKEYAELLAASEEALDKLIVDSQKKGNLASVNALTAQKAEVKEGVVPAISSIPSQKRAFAKANRQLGIVIKARREAIEEYQKAIKALTVAGKIKEANDLAAELRTIRFDILSLPDRVAAIRQGVRTEGVPWLIDGDELFSNPQQVDQMGSVWFGDPEWSEYEFSYEMRLDNQDGRANAQFHVADKDNHRVLEIGSYDNMAKDLFSVTNAKWERGNGDAFVRPGVDFGKWQRFTLKVSGSKVVVIFNGQEIVNKEKRNFTSGMLGFSYHGGATARVRNVVVKTPDGLYLWKGVQGLGQPR